MNALVTGGTKGIGKACVRRLTAEGYAVVATYRNDEEAAERLRAELQSSGGLVIESDLGDQEAQRHLLSELDRSDLVPDILICNAAYQRKARVSETEPELLSRTLEINVVSNYALIRSIAQRWTRTGSPGVIVVVSSNQSELINPTGFAYAISKAALNHMVRHLALAFAERKIRVNGVVLGWFDTEGERVFYSAERIADQAARTIPLGRAGSAEEAAELIAFLASSRSSYVTGSLLRIDGGYSLAPDAST